MELSEKKTRMFQGYPALWFAVFLIIVLAGSYLNLAPKGFIGAMAYCLALGIFFTMIGDRIPFIKKYLGGGSVVNLFACSLLVYFNLIPKPTLDAVKMLGNTADLFGFVSMTLIMGSILGMDRQLLIKAGARFGASILGAVLVGSLLVAGGGFLLGFGGTEALLTIGFPIFGAGVASGAVPMSQIYESITGIDAGNYLSQLMPAVAIGNALAIIMAGFLKNLGTWKPSLMGSKGGSAIKGYTPSEKEWKPLNVGALGRGLVVTGIFMTAGVIIAKFVPIHYYATTIILCAIVKICNILPETLIDDTHQWYNFVSSNFVPAIIAVTGLASMDFSLLVSALDWRYLILVVLSVGGSALGAGLFGRLVGFYPVEAGITGGLCMANMGGSGDVATLAAADRMDLMPFAQISSRLGGAFIIILVNVAARILLG
jgi:Na+/citrate or Na+/malate symporter